MFETLDEALLLVQSAFSDVSRGALFMSDAELAADVEAAQRVINAAAAVQALRMAQYAAREDELGPDGSCSRRDRGVGYVAEFAGDCLGPALRLTSVGAARKVGTAAKLASCLPATLAAMAAGDVDPWRATVVADELQDADRDVCAAVEERIFPAVLGDTAGRARARVRRALSRIDIAVLRSPAAASPADTPSVRVFPGALVGTSQWRVVMETTVSVACKAAVDALAHQLNGDDPDSPLGACRAEALASLVLGSATVTTTVDVLVPVDVVDSAQSPTEVERDEDGEVVGPSYDQLRAMGYEVPGVGVIAGEEMARLCADVQTRVRRVLIDSATGVIAETGAATYRPPARMVEFVRLRDGTCRFPGCSRTSRRCDLDHVVPWPLGPTGPANLMALCRHHHRVKHRTAWRVTMTPEGRCTWTDPFGTTFTTTPIDHRDILVAS